jgi:hypothetical protein
MAEQLGIKDMITEVAEREARIVEIDTKLRKELENQDESKTAGGDKEEKQL